AARIAQIKRAIGLEGLRISETEKAKLKAEVRAIVEEQKDAFIKAYVSNSGVYEDRLRKGFDEKSYALDLFVVEWALNNNDDETAQKTRDRLIAQLDPQTREILTTPAPRGGGREQRLRNWVWESMPSRR